MNSVLCYIVIGVLWMGWLFPFAFLAPHGQKRAHITVAGPTRLGLLFETAAIFLAFLIHGPLEAPVAPLRFTLALISAAAGIQLSFGAVKHLGRQFRIHAGLYHDHRLVTSGPYGVVRHPIYSGLLAMLLATILIGTPWQWGAASVLLFLAGTEIRVRTEDKLLASRFGNEFYEYQKRVPAYLPFVR